MWLHVPGMPPCEDLPYVPVSEDSSWASTSPSVTDIELWAHVSGIPSPRPLSWYAWRNRGWVRRLYGTILRPSLAGRSAARWISSLRGSRASRSRSPESAEGPRTNAGSGGTSHGLFAWYDRDSSSWRTSEDCLPIPGDSDEYSETWPKAGSMRNGRCSQRSSLERRTYGSGSSYSRGEYPTPSRTSYGSSQNEGQAETWATPISRDYKDGAAATSSVPTNSFLGRQAPRTDVRGDDSLNETRRLNPRFVEMLMGFPIGWTGSGRLETESFRSWLHTHSALLRSALDLT